MFIIKVNNGQVVGDMVDYREVFGKAVPTDEQLTTQGYMRINLFRAHDSLTEKLVPSSPLVEGDWVYAMSVVSMTPEEVQASKDSAMANIRANRNKLLTATDGTQAVDNPNLKKSEWAIYRQELRDLPFSIIESAVDPRTFNTWPEQPE